MYIITGTIHYYYDGYTETFSTTVSKHCLIDTLDLLKKSVDNNKRNWYNYDVNHNSEEIIENSKDTKVKVTYRTDVNDYNLTIETPRTISMVLKESML